MTRKPFITILLLVLLAFGARAATNTAASVSQAAIQAAVDLSHTGDTVYIPAGTYSIGATTYLSITNDISFLGAGTNQTILVDVAARPNANSGNLMLKWVTTSGLCRISGISFNGGFAASNVVMNAGYNVYDLIGIQGTTPALLIDHCEFDTVFCTSIKILGATFGVVSDCNWHETNIDSLGNGYTDMIETENGHIGGETIGGVEGYGDGSWSTNDPVQYGTTNEFVYVEGCNFQYDGSFDYFDDSCAGSRVCYRYDTFINCGFQTHGTESSQRTRGTRAVEIYECVFNWPNSANTPDFYMRSGDGVIWSNTIIGGTTFYNFFTFRSVTWYYAFGSDNGLNTWDECNLTPIATGTHTGTNNSPVLVDSGQSFTVNQFIGGYEVADTSQTTTNSNYTGSPYNVIFSPGTNDGTFSLIGSNTATAVYSLRRITGSGDFIRWNNGDTYKIYYVTQQLDQIGAGGGDLIQDTVPNNGIPVNSRTGLPTSPLQQSEPLYFWGNSFNGTTNYQLTANNNYNFAYGVGPFNNVQLGRDFFNTNKPGYTPLVYPHPLVTADENPQTNAPAASNVKNLNVYGSFIQH